MSNQKVIETKEEIASTPDEGSKKVVRTTTQVIPESQDEELPAEAMGTKKVIFRTYQVVWYVLGVIEILLTFRFILKLVGANPLSGFTGFIYSLSHPFSSPFLGIIASSVSGNSVVEWSTLIAMSVYPVIVWLITEFFQIIKPVNKQEIEQKVDKY